MKSSELFYAVYFMQNGIIKKENNEVSMPRSGSLFIAPCGSAGVPPHHKQVRRVAVLYSGFFKE